MPNLEDFQKSIPIDPEKDLGIAIEKEVKFQIRYSIREKEYTDILDSIFDIKGEEVENMPIAEVERIHVDVAYYRSSLFWACDEAEGKLKELVRNFHIWLAQKRRRILVYLQEQRIRTKIEQKCNLGDITKREIDDVLIADNEEEYKSKVEQIGELESGVSFLKGIISDLDERRIQFQGICKRRNQ